jgi:hypothetical protein
MARRVKSGRGDEETCSHPGDGQRVVFHCSSIRLVNGRLVDRGEQAAHMLFGQVESDNDQSCTALAGRPRRQARVDAEVSARRG